MSLPSVDIIFQDGNLGFLPDNTDGLIVVVVTGASEGTVSLNTPYVITKSKDLTDLGLTTANNASLVNFVTDFYKNVSEGTPMWFLVVNNAVTPINTIYSTNKALLVKLLRATSNLATSIFVLPPVGTFVTQAAYTAFTVLASAFRTEYLTSDNAPVLSIIDYLDYDSTTAITAITTAAGVGGYTAKNADGKTSIGCLAGRYANNSIQRNVGAVQDGIVVTNGEQYHDEVTVKQMDKAASIHDAKFITLRVHNGYAGYYFTDDPLFVPSTSDYKSVTAQRTIDKAYRIAFKFLTYKLLVELGTKENGSLRDEVAKDLEAQLCAKIKKEMTDLGQLNADPNNPNDWGVICSIDTAYNTLGNSRIKLNYLHVKPFGYARYVSVPLGFVPIQ